MKLTLIKKKFKTPKENRVKRPRVEKVMLSVVFVIALIYAITLLFPFVWISYNSLKTDGYYEFLLDPWGLPKNAIEGFKNYANVFKMKVAGLSFMAMLINSIEYSFVLTGLTIWFTTIIAYTLVMYRFKLRPVFYGIFSFNIAVNIIGGQASMIKLLSDIGLYGTYYGIYLFGIPGFGSTTLVVMAFFNNMAWDYGESAMIDGAGHWRIFLSIYLPMAVPIMVTIGILSFIGFWNDYTNILIYAKSRPNLAYGVNMVNTTLTQKGQYPQAFAYMMLSIIPGVLLFLCFQKVILKNFNMGGLKG
ncbi:MAG: carbohydrate ABC transporter permease [Clostridia bacterium]|nr:carbohydrate ABC transporter permease [Clostridia bacterium]